MRSYGVTANNTGACAYIILQSFLCTKGPSADEIALERSSEGAQFVEEKGWCSQLKVQTDPGQNHWGQYTTTVVVVDISTYVYVYTSRQ